MSTNIVAINKDTSVVIAPAHPESDLNQSIYAINWFNYKAAWLYKLYSLLVLPDVKSIGGKPVIKGKVLEKWEGDDALDRNILLIVKYPSADQFLKMIARKSFQAKSILRMNAVKDFVFGFTRKVKDDRATIKSGLHDFYLLHLFQTDHPQASFENQLEELKKEGISIYFYATKTAYIGRRKNGEDVKKLPFVLDGVLILQSKSLSNLQKLGDNKDYRSFKDKHTMNNIYLLKRTV